MPELLEGYAFTIQWFPGHMTKAKRQMECEHQGAQRRHQPS